MRLPRRLAWWFYGWLTEVREELVRLGWDKDRVYTVTGVIYRPLGEALWTHLLKTTMSPEQIAKTAKDLGIW